MFHDEAGSGPPVVFLHPGLADSGVWDPQRQLFADSFTVLRFDVPGFGRSPIEREAIAPARDIADAIEGRGGCAFVGNSLGGRIALEIAIDRPGLVRALVLVGVLVHVGEPSPALKASREREQAAWEAGDLDAATEANLDAWLAPGAEPDVREAVRLMQRNALELQFPWEDRLVEERLVPDIADRLGEVRVPTLVVVGSEDIEDVQRFGQVLAETIPGAATVVIEGAGHVPSLERPQAFNEAVLPFLQRALS